MARRRSRETPYERRIRRYLEQHPGATRQEARGHKPPSKRRGAEYRERIERARGRYPGLPERMLRRGGFLRFLNYLREGDLVTLDDPVWMIDVDDRGRLHGLVKLVVPPRRPERRFRLGSLTKPELRDLVEAELERGALLTVIPSLDQRSLV